MIDGPDTLFRAAESLCSAREVVVFTGAGVSAESGIPTFRDEAGLWQRFPPQQFATLNGLMKTAAINPRRLAEFLLAVLEPIAAAEPNAAHRAIAELEQHKNVTVITQNVDRLHQEAGSTTVLEVHGSLFEIVTPKGQVVRLISRPAMRRIVDTLRSGTQSRVALPKLLAAIRPILGLGIRGTHRPSIVLFGEEMAEPAWTRSRQAVRRCDCLIAVGTSGTVMPAAMLPDEAKGAGATIISINYENGGADFGLKGPAAELTPALLQAAFGRP